MDSVTTFSNLLESLPSEAISPPSNTIAHIFKNDYKENFMSDWLAFLLSPENMGTAEPLNCLLSLIGKESVSVSIDEDISMDREYTFKSGRRIDFLIETENYLIGIENKIWSDLEKDQLKDYQKSLNKKQEEITKKPVQILLYPERNKSNNLRKAIDTNSLFDFRPITYESLIESFKQIRINCISNLRAAFMLQDFITHMEEFIMDTETKIDFNMLQFFNSHAKEVEEIKEKNKNSKLQFKQYLDSKLDELAKELDKEIDSDEIWQHFSSGTSDYFQLYKGEYQKKNGWGYFVHFELMKPTGELFPPQSLQVVLHTREGRRKNRESELYKLQDKVSNYLKEKHGKDTFEIDYASHDAFERSIDVILEKLKEVVLEYWRDADFLIKKEYQQQH